MKIICKTIGKTLLALIVILAAQELSAQKNKRLMQRNGAINHNKVKMSSRHSKNDMSRNHAVKVLKRTNHVIVDANKAVKKHKNYSGDLSKALHHQRYAKRLFKNNKIKKSLQHSRIAREYAFKAIKLNKGVINEAFQFTDEERKIIGTNTPDIDLDNELKKSYPAATFNDEKVTDKELTELDVLEMDPAEYTTE